MSDKTLPKIEKAWDERFIDGKRAFDDYCYKLGELDSITEKHYFIIGFRMGTQIMFDLMGEYQGDLSRTTIYKYISLLE